MRFSFMSPFNLADWLKRFIRPRSCATTIVKNRLLRLSFEEQENRLAPAVWMGAAGNPNWSSVGNWQGGIIPTAGAPVDLEFPTAATTYVSNNNIAGLVVNSLTIGTGSNYTITASPGDQIILGNPSTTTGLIQVNTSASASISADIQLGNAASSTEIINVQAGALLTRSDHL